MFTSVGNRTWSKEENDVISKHILSLTIVQRTLFILSSLVLFWIGFLLIYFFSRFILRLIAYFHSLKTTNGKISHALIISTNQYGSFPPIHTDSLFTIPNEPVHLTINLFENSHTSLLEHYLKTYNPLQIDVKNINSTSNISEEFSSEIDTQPVGYCYPLNCTNQERYVRLKEQENCSETIDQFSECSTKLTGTIIPVIMITDCSNSERLHTDIIEEEEEI